MKRENKRGNKAPETTTKSQTKLKAEKVVREVEPRKEEIIYIKKKKNEYIYNYQYQETKELKRNNPRYFGIVEHLRKGDIFGEEIFNKLVHKNNYAHKEEIDQNYQIQEIRN